MNPLPPLTHGWSQITAIFGGTFDPPHLGHTEAIQGLFKNPGVDRTLALLSPIPPHKQAPTPLEHRLKMAQIAFSGLADVRLDLREVQRAQKQPKTFPQERTYTYDTLMELRAEGIKPAFVVGTDQLLELHTWYKFPEVLGLSHWIVLKRQGTPAPLVRKALSALAGSGILEPIQSGDLQGQWKTRFGTQLLLTPTNAPEISSSAIREAIARTGSPPEQSLLPEITSYLKLHRIYGTATKL
ncbi:nicotinate-nicotinamide nucleotide adenylyltransferase [Bdellovibrionota bacterium FG-2]